MTVLRLQKFVTAICLILCLVVSAVSACACCHHNLETKAETVPACHRHQAKAKAHELDAGAASMSDCDCRCFESAGRLSAKSEPIKLKHQPAATAKAAPEITVPEASLDAHLAVFEKLHFLTDPYYNLSPGRAPPRA